MNAYPYLFLQPLKMYFSLILIISPTFFEKKIQSVFEGATLNTSDVHRKAFYVTKNYSFKIIEKKTICWVMHQIIKTKKNKEK